MDLTRLYKERKIHSSSDFEWLKQARFYWRPGEDDPHGAGSCVISICDVDFKYRFEYLGCKVNIAVLPTLLMHALLYADHESPRVCAFRFTSTRKIPSPTRYFHLSHSHYRPQRTPTALLATRFYRSDW